MYITYQLALEAVRRLQGPLRLIAKRDPQLADQIRRASQNAALNIGESRGRRDADRRRVLRIAAAEVYESATGLDLAVASEYLEDTACTDARDIIEELVRVLWPQTR